MAYLLGLDISTTGAKALLIDARGRVVASATTEYRLSTPRPLWSEQSPADWWQGACASITAALKQAGLSGDDVSGVGLTGQMHGLVLMDKGGQVLRPAILWNDQRTGPQCAEITDRVGGLGRLLELTGNPVLPGFTAPKILWVQQNEPTVYERVAHILLPKDYVRYCLTGEYATEVSDASGTSLLDVARRRWSEAMLDAVEVRAEWLPRCEESPVVSGAISPAAAQATGLRPGTPVVGGGGDQAAQAIGTGVVRPGMISVTSGTSGVIFAYSEAFAPEPQGRLHAFCHAVPGKWHVLPYQTTRSVDDTDLSCDATIAGVGAAKVRSAIIRLSIRTEEAVGGLNYAAFDSNDLDPFTDLTRSVRLTIRPMPDIDEALTMKPAARLKTLVTEVALSNVAARSDML